MISRLISGQEEMVIVPDDSNRTHAHIDRNPKFEVNQMVVYLPTLSTPNNNGTKRNYKQMNLLPKAAPPADVEEFHSCPNSPSPLELQAQDCLSSLSVPQVEKNVLETTLASDKCVQLAKSVEKPRTHSAARAERFMIPASL